LQIISVITISEVDDANNSGNKKPKTGLTLIIYIVSFKDVAAVPTYDITSENQLTELIDAEHHPQKGQ